MSLNVAVAIPPQVSSTNNHDIRLGIVEAVSALVLLGSSVDYSLHVAEAFVDCSQHNRVSANPMGRSGLVTQALTKIGVSVLHASATTIVSVVCLLFCTIKLFDGN